MKTCFIQDPASRHFNKEHGSLFQEPFACHECRRQDGMEVPIEIRAVWMVHVAEVHERDGQSGVEISEQNVLGKRKRGLDRVWHNAYTAYGSDQGCGCGEGPEPGRPTSISRPMTSNQRDTEALKTVISSPRRRDSSVRACLNPGIPWAAIQLDGKYSSLA